MFSVALSSRLAVLATAAAYAVAQDTTAPPVAMETFPATPHASKMYEYTALPYQIDDSTNLIRGRQHGYNICNSTTENQESLCQTAMFNSIEDFCLWGPPEYGQEVGDIEGIMVAYCTQPGRGTRLIPEGALTGVQWIRTPAYVQAVGFIDQTMINVLEGDWGGEMDPHGADLRGNPMGGILFSEAFTGQPEQVVEWHLFLGGNRFCFKACDHSVEDDDRYCEHILDRIGCDYNIPNRAVDGVFESCLGDNQDFPGVYTTNGEVMTYSQPEGPIGDVGFTPITPASSSCTTYESAALYTGLPSGSSSATSTADDAEPTSVTSSRTTAGTTGSTSRGGSAAAATGNPDSGASTFVASGFAAISAVFAAVLLA